MGDFSQAVYSIRQDVTVKLLDQGVIQDPVTKEIVYNLAQQDMIALRVVFRMGWALPNPATRMDENRTMCSFAYLEPAAALTAHTVTFTVTGGGDEDGAALKGARVEINGVRKLTDAGGKASFTLEDGAYQAHISAKGFAPVTESVAVSGAAAAKDVALIPQ